ncbi:hypothetical protein LARV_01214 [Longilinea arvoryzae]|uniref:Glycosyltransferase RgtA/B/C/D-like domain-containing protein n=1 Tax=Longilinea arvoryzae TaxID=360412 RepID=A0A0S7BEV4_9CHLR|nr:hypothetical protein [Longilinea arvoryzae]GAP13460.1 hypothetical protein LARV_01214 [Longilinea arvoryzae]
MKTNPWLLAIGLILLSILALILGRAMMPVTPALTHDSAAYLNAAENLASSGQLRIDMTLTTAQESSRRLCAYMPGYAVFLSGLLRLGISESAALYGLTLAGLILMGLMVAVLVRELTHSLFLAIAAGAILLIFQPLLDTMTYALTETLYIPVSLALIWVISRYVRSARPEIGVIILLVASMAALSLLRIVGAMLVAVAGGVLVLRSLLNRRWRRAAGEVGLTALSQIPAAAVLLANYQQTGRIYCATNSAGWNIERTTRGLLAQLLLGQFKPDLSLGLGLRGFVEALPGIAIGIVLVILALALVYLAWRARKQLGQAGRDLATWPVLVMVLYLAVYYGFFFVFGNTWARWDFPRYFVPGYPFILILGLLVLDALFRRLPYWPVRVALLLGLAGVVFAYAQTSLRQIPVAAAGRGIEAAEVGDQPVMAYLRQNLKESDLLFSTREPTLWYYFRRPVRRVMGLTEISCRQLQAPPAGGRSLFVLFPEGNYPGDPASAEDESWFRGWIESCGRVADHQVFGDSAVYIIEWNNR